MNIEELTEMDESPTHDSSIQHSAEFPSSMLTDRDKLMALRQKLAEAIRETIPDPGRYCPGYEGKAADAAKKLIDCNEVYPGIILGDGTTARNQRYLKKIGVTHVLNAAYGDYFGYVDTDEKFYQPSNFKFLGLRVIDMPNAKISSYFDQSANFIEDALASKGKVYVHCVMGVSRSSTIVIAYLMIKRGFTAEQAIRHVRSRRCIIPNEGFLMQLATLDLKLGDRRELVSAEIITDNEGSMKKKPCQLC